jgi:hypothetical protein
VPLRVHAVTFLPDGPLTSGGVQYDSLHQRVAEAIRCAGIEWHRDHDPRWRDKPYQDGINVDLDEDDQLDALTAAALFAVEEVLL